MTDKKEYQLTMKYIGNDMSGFVEAKLIKPDGAPFDHIWEAETYAEVIHEVFYELGHRLIKDDHILTVKFEV